MFLPPDNSPKQQPFAGPVFRLIALTASLLFAGIAQAVTLAELLRAAADTHPTVQAARQEINAANEDVDAARRQYWPTLSASMESGTSNDVAAPARLLRAEQTIWDFGRTRSAVNASERAADIAGAAMEAQRQTLGLQVIDAWRSLQAGYGRMRVAQEMLKRLQMHEAMMMRRVTGELSTQVDLDLVRSRILQGRVELTQAQTAIHVAITRLQNLTGLQDLEFTLSVPPPLPAREQLDAQYRLLDQIDWDGAVNRQPSVLRADEETRLGQERINIKAAESRPQVYARLDQAINGRRDTAAYVGVRYSPGAGFATFVEARALAARALALEQSAQAARIEARQSLDVDRDDMRDNGLRADSLYQAVQGAQRVFESYERQFTAGRKSWIDLMNTVREVAQNAYTLVDAHAAQAAALYRLQLRVNPDLIDVPVEIPDAAAPPVSGREDDQPLKLVASRTLSVPPAREIASASAPASVSP